MTFDADSLGPVLSASVTPSAPVLFTGVGVLGEQFNGRSS
jgi:hypothetical protein